MNFIFVKLKLTSMRCPKCKQDCNNNNRLRIPRFTFDRLIPFTRRFMCLNCGLKFLKFLRFKTASKRAGIFKANYFKNVS